MRLGDGKKSKNIGYLVFSLRPQSDSKFACSQFKLRPPVRFAAFLFSLFFSLVVFAAGSDFVKFVRKANEGRVADAYAGLLKQINDSASGKNQKIEKPEDLHLQFFALGQWALQLKKFPEARSHLEMALKYGQTNTPHIQYLIGHSYKEEGNNQKAVQAFNRVFELNPPLNIAFDSRSELSAIAIQTGQIWKARENLRYLEKRWRGTPKYPEVIWQLMALEFKDNRRHLACKWARKLYARYPADVVVKGWGVNLQENKFGEKTIGCIASQKELRERIRHLRLSGLEDQARKEIEVLKSHARPSEMVEVEMLLAEHLENQGYPDDALRMLTSHYVAAKRDLNFLTLFAKIAARAGEFQMAIGAYVSVHKHSPRSRLGRNALFMAAYLSYQIQDYDGAYRKFTDITDKYRGSSLARDARWHLAWLQYLKGNYESAEKAYRALAEEKIYKRRRRVVRPFQDDRTKYWLAMSFMKQDKKSDATRIFAQLVNEKSYGFYSLLAQNRLDQLPVENQVSRVIANVPPSVETKVDESEEFRSVTPSLLFSPHGQLENVSDESEENIQVGDAAEAETAEGDSSSESAIEGEPPSVTGPKFEAADTETNMATAVSGDAVVKISNDVEKVQVTTFSDPRLRAKFQSANNLIALGLNEWAKWELYEIERRTSNKAYLKMLMDAYVKIGYYNRSMYIAEIYFSSERQKLGFEAGREYWVHNYPRAYADMVELYAKKFNVPESLVFAIMRAESQFNKEALSPVGARGLMQIMPYTATQVLRLLGEAATDEKNLFLPDVNIRLGTRYLSRLQKKFQGQVPLIAAGYNSGPHRVFSWLSTFGNLNMDEFIEHVPFVETRNYVKKVVRNYAIYNEIYGRKRAKYNWLIEPVPLKVSERPSPRENWENVD